MVKSSLFNKGSASARLHDELQMGLMMPEDCVKRNGASGILIDDLRSYLKHLVYVRGSAIYHNGLLKTRGTSTSA